jgi:Arc/MetJ-type ribon-helix-helix transcriptional regulator
MATGSETDPEMVKIDVKVTKQRKEAIDRAWKKRGYPNRSEFVRDVLRDATQPTLTPEALRELARGLEDIETGRTTSLNAAKGELDVDESR